MPCCTYLSGDEYTKPTSDSELNDLLRCVREATGDDWRIGEQEFVVRRWFRRQKVVKQYTLYNHVASVEFQIVNFYRPDREDNSINMINDAGFVAAYLYGVLAGVQTTQHGDPR